MNKITSNEWENAFYTLFVRSEHDGISASVEASVTGLIDFISSVREEAIQKERERVRKWAEEKMTRADNIDFYFLDAKQLLTYLSDKTK
jgi:hypothetical protein